VAEIGVFGRENSDNVHFIAVVPEIRFFVQ
jgi:hypothetical protein